MQVLTSSTHLSRETPSGFFQGLCGRLFWVFESLKGQVAVQLEGGESHHRFAYLHLGARPVLEGHWRGPVKLAVGRIHATTRRGYCGAIMWDRDLIYLKANSSSGRGEYLRIWQYRQTSPSPERRFFHSWRLSNEGFEGEPLTFEQTGGLPRMWPYPKNFFEV